MTEASPRAGPAARPRARGTARIHRVLHLRTLSPATFVLRFSREGLDFRAGQWVNLGLPGARDQREYSMYSSPHDDFLEVLVREIPSGAVSGALHRRRPGDELEVDGPHGSFCLVEGSREQPGFLLLATGAGISPFHSFVRSAPGLDYQLVHGVRSRQELYDRDAFDAARLLPCISRDGPATGGATAAYAGRLTAWLAAHPADPSRYCYMCGNSDMIYEAYALLRRQGVHPSRIFAEVYF
jgi:ferredoxin/flavodoxin---NADP+ reductase